MERFINTDKPLSALTGIRQSIQYDDNSTNIKLQSKKNMEGLNHMLLNRQHSIQQIRKIQSDINNSMVTKLTRILSKRFSLKHDDYVILIDKYNLNSDGLTRNTIMEMIQYLNMRNRFRDDEVIETIVNTNNSLNVNTNNSLNVNTNTNSFVTTNSNVNTMNISTGPVLQNSIIPPAGEPEIDILDIDYDNQDNLETRYQQLLDSRKANMQIKPEDDTHPHVKQSEALIPEHIKLNKDTQLPIPQATSVRNVFKETDMPHKSDFNLDYEALKQNIDKDVKVVTYNSKSNTSKSNELENIKLNNSEENKLENITLHTSPYIQQAVTLETEPETNILQNNQSDIPSNITPNIPSNITPNIPPNIPQYNQELSDSIVQDIGNSFKDMISNLSHPPSIQEPETETLNIMANIIDSKHDSNESFIFNIDYDGKKEITNIISIELVSCFVNENFYKKNDFKNSPYFLIKILEFKDILYLNGSAIGGFCQVLWEKKGNYYHYLNNDKLFGVYSPPKDFILNKLGIEVYDHKGQLLDEIKSTDNDQFNMIFKITIQSTD